MRWLQDLVQWLRDRLGVVGESPSFLKTIEAQDGDAKAWLLADDSIDTPIAGLASLWYLWHVTATADCILLLVNISQANEGVHGQVDRQLPLWRRAFEIEVRRALRQSDHIAASHVFIVGWLPKRALVQRVVVIDGKPITKEFRELQCTTCLAVDLQGATVAFAGANAYGKRIIHALAIAYTNMEPTEHTTWEGLMRSLDDMALKVNWKTRLEYYASKHEQTKISKDHVLQPPKARLRSRE